MNKKMNVLLISSDQQHWSSMGCNNPELITPNLDRLAKQGTVFDRAYCPNPTCTPTRASIITGLYPSQHGAYSLGTRLPENVPTVGESFRKYGYRSALIGKAHFQQLLSTPEYPSVESNPFMQNLDYWKSFSGPFYGFEHVELLRNHTDEHHVGQHYVIWMEEQGFHEWRDCFQIPGGNASPQKWEWNLPEEYHYNRWIAERSRAMLDSYKANDENFFLWASFPDPHPSYLVSSPWDTMYDPDKLSVPLLSTGEHEKNPPHFKMTQELSPDFSKYQEPEGHWCHGFHSHLCDRKSLAKDIAVYYGMISMMDKYIGSILDKLDELGLAENTLVVFTTDHGHFFGQHGLIAKGAFHYEDMIKIPFIARLPGLIPEGQRSESLISLVDLAPTFLACAGIPVPRTMSGINQMSVFSGADKSLRTGIIVENRHQPHTLNLRTYVNRRYKLTVYCGHDYGEFFDLEEDPGEVRNLWDSPAHSALKSQVLLEFLSAEMEKDPLPMPRVFGA